MNLCYNKDKEHAVEYLFPVPGGTVTTGFWDLRPYSLAWEARTRIHRGWDIADADVKDQEIVAPEAGRVYYQYNLRCPLDKTAWLKRPDGTNWTFSQWYADTMGGVIVLEGDSGYTYAFGHIDADVIFMQLYTHRVPYEWKRITDGYNKYIHYVNNLDTPRRVSRGDVLGHIGHSGYSTGYHTHMQIHADRSYDSRIDPAELWPDERIYDNGAGPERGTRDGAEHIPPANHLMNLDYMRGT